MANQCIFCRIVAGEIPAARVYEDEAVIAFRDIHPQAPVHVLVIPREHVASVDALGDEHRALAGRLLTAVPHVARAVGGLEEGYRLIVNNGAAAGQTVHHLHLHVLGGRELGERMVG